MSVNYVVNLDISNMNLKEAQEFIDMIRQRDKVDGLHSMKWNMICQNPQMIGKLPGEATETVDKNQKAP